MKSTRQRLLEYLRRHPDATAADLARGLRLTHADVRYHVNLLLTEGVVVVSGQRKRGRGRPARAFRLVSDVNPQRFDLLSSALLTEHLAGLPPTDVEVFLRSVAARLGFQPSAISDQRTAFIHHSSSLSTRLVHAVARLNELGYRARWEAHAESPLLILDHCPFSKLHDRHPELRQLDQYLIETLLAFPISRLSGSGDGYPRGVYGVFVVGK